MAIRTLAVPPTGICTGVVPRIFNGGGRFAESLAETVRFRVCRLRGGLRKLRQLVLAENERVRQAGRCSEPDLAFARFCVRGHGDAEGDRFGDGGIALAVGRILENFLADFGDFALSPVMGTGSGRDLG